MYSRQQQQTGWIGAWLGAFSWVLLLSVVFLVQGKVLHGGIGLLISCAACVAIVVLAPWRHPQTRYRTLMAPIYLLLLTAVVWGAWSFGGLRQMGIGSWWSAFILLPVLLPLWIAGGRRWSDGEAYRSDTGSSRKPEH